MREDIQRNEALNRTSTQHLGQHIMKKFIIGATAALIATVSLASAAEAGWKWKHRHNGWKRHHWGVVVVSPRYYGDYCFVKKVKRYDDWGNVYIKRVRVCG
jgi:hypothetical protein